MKLLIGGSPCTHWSIAQTKNRETEASGIGWELFLNYRIARDKYQPDFFMKTTRVCHPLSGRRSRRSWAWNPCLSIPRW